MSPSDPKFARPEPLAGPIAYVTGEYPKVSHTFIQREIMALRQLGAKVLTCTVRRPLAKTIVGADQQAEAAATYCVMDAALAPRRLLAAHFALLTRSPGRWFSALRLAFATRPPGLKALVWQAFYFAEAGVLARHMQDQGVVHMHNHFGDSSGSLTMLASELSGIPFSITMHGPSLFFEARWWHIDAKVARAGFIACISHFCRSQVMLFSDQIHWDKLRIVHCGVEPTTYGHHPRRDFTGHLVFVGRLDAVKGVSLLLQAFAAARSDYPNAHLTIAGDGPARNMLEAQAKALGVQAAVQFAGYLDESAVTALLDDADMLVLPSFAEGVPVVLMEAMASRLPVIATQVGGVPELVDDGLSGFLVPPGDVENLTVRLRALLGDQGLCARMGEAGRQKVLKEHDIAVEAAWLYQLFAGTGRGLRPADVAAKNGSGGPSFKIDS